jgi:hypothetical protein
MQEITLRIELTPKQSSAHEYWIDSATYFLLFGGGAGGGKSFWIASEQIIQCYQYPGIKSFIARKELKRLMTSTYLTFVKACSFYGVPKEDWHLNGQYNYIEFKNGSRIDLLDINFIPSDPLYERFGSTEYTNGFIEEGGESEFGAFDVLKSRVGRHRNQEFGLLGKIGVTANPTKNYLYRIFFRPFKEKILPKGYAFVQSLYGDNPYTAQAYGVQLSQIADKSQRERLREGNWEYSADPTSLVDYEAMLDMFTNTVDEGEKAISVDVARHGVDKTVKYLWKGLKLYGVRIYAKQDTAITSTKLKLISQQERTPYSRIVVDEDGIGGAVVDNCKGIKGFIANSPAMENPKTHQVENYANLKAQCGYKLAESINKHLIAIDIEPNQFVSEVVGITFEKWRELLIEELECLKSKDIDKDQKLKIISKDEIKESLGRSPDFLDTLIMRMMLEYRTSGGNATVFVPNPAGYLNPSPQKSPLRSGSMRANVHIPSFRK